LEGAFFLEGEKIKKRQEDELKKLEALRKKKLEEDKELERKLEKEE